MNYAVTVYKDLPLLQQCAHTTGGMTLEEAKAFAAKAEGEPNTVGIRIIDTMTGNEFVDAPVEEEKAQDEN